MQMWRKFLYSGFETCFGPSTQGARTKTHLKSKFCAILTKFTPHLRLQVDEIKTEVSAVTRSVVRGES